MPDTAFTLALRGRSTYRINLRRDHLPAPIQKALAKLEDANTQRAAADQALETCGYGTGPKLAEFEKTVDQAEDRQLEALDAVIGGAVRGRAALLDSTTAAYDAALERATHAERALLDALDEAADAAALHACAQAGAALNVDDRTARQHPARAAAAGAAATVRSLNLPALDA